MPTNPINPANPENPENPASPANEIRKKGTKPHHHQSISLKTQIMIMPNHPLSPLKLGKMVPKSMEFMRRSPIQEKKVCCSIKHWSMGKAS
jgi:hypothetical protein